MSSTNINQIIKQLEEKRLDYEKKVFAGLNDAADILKIEMVRSINEISNGIKYGKHIASKAGDAPNVDTGRLKNSIQKKSISVDSIEVGSYNTEYATYLELGTSRMEPRPFVQPALDKNRKVITKIISEALK